MKIICVLSLFFLSLVPFASSSGIDITEEEQKLYELIMKYRESKGLPLIPLSKSLTYVAQQHVIDLAENKPNKGDCNFHSWSKKGKWKGCCYTDDHKRAECMWNKPRELTSYEGNGYEIATGYDDSITHMDAETALEGWKTSPAHNSVIINSGIWRKPAWKSIGVGVYKGFAVVWFGNEEDSEPKD
jgi:uncharacterized protein YkwD